MSNFKPNLAAKITDPARELRFPQLVSYKLDGIRCTIVDGEALTRSLKPVPNDFMRNELSNPKYNGLDGEIIVGAAFAEDVFNKTTRAVMSHSGRSLGFNFCVFDNYLHGGPFGERYRSLKDKFDYGDHNRQFTLMPLTQTLVSTLDELLEFEVHALGLGYEGVCGRSLDSIYKFGHSTIKEGGLWKLKRFSDAEAEIIGFEEQMFNSNEAFKDELGRTKRSSAQYGKVGKDTLGAFICRTPEGILFNVGSGMNDATRKHIWNNRDVYLGRQLTYKFFNVGVKEAPRHPIYKGVRADVDIDPKPDA